ncbi:MAG: AMP-binding protein [Betaproteobacteria bacterium]|nr:AMP-binding protein [Betaproteobacteria bacterium]
MGVERALYTRLVSGVLFPAHERLKGHATVELRRALEASQWWPRSQIETLRLDRLKAFLSAAQADVPYYAELFARLGFHPEKMHSIAALGQLPTLTKATIRANFPRLASRRAEGLREFNTGGSSGEPLIFGLGRDRVAHDVAAKWRATRWWDVDVGDPEIVLWGSPIELNAQDRLRGLRDRLFRTRLLPAFEMSETRLDGFLHAIRGRRPRMLFGYPSALALVARHARARGQRMDDLGIRVAFATAERLYDEQRNGIEEVFGCRVANGYGGRDAGFVAHECPNGGMHITAEDVVVEIVDAQGHPVPAGQSGEIVVTHMGSGDFPFIRYRTGDVGALARKSCPCGRGLPLLEKIEGRTTDFIVAADGTVIHGLALIYTVRALPGVKAFKIVQEDVEHVRVLLMAERDFAWGPGREAIVRDFQRRLGPATRVEVEPVDALPAERSGKYRYVVSHVAACKW